MKKQDKLDLANVLWPYKEECFEVVGESFHLKEIQIVKEHIQKHPAWCPQRAILTAVANPHDEHAVGVFFPVLRKGWFGSKWSPTQVGYLRKDLAKRFRNDLKRIGMAGLPLICCGCVVDNEKTQHPTVRIFLPIRFAKYVDNGFCGDPTNCPPWLVDEAPVEKKAPAKKAGEEFSDDELRKLFFYKAQQKSWHSLPDRAEASLQGFRDKGIGALHFMVQEHRP